MLTVPENSSDKLRFFKPPLSPAPPEDRAAAPGEPGSSDPVGEEGTEKGCAAVDDDGAGEIDFCTLFAPDLPAVFTDLDRGDVLFMKDPVVATDREETLPSVSILDGLTERDVIGPPAALFVEDIGVVLDKYCKMLLGATADLREYLTRIKPLRAI